MTHKRGRPIGSPSPTRRIATGLSQLARQHFPPELMIELCLSVLQGHDAIIVKDHRATTTGGWKVEHREGGPIPDIATRERFMLHLRNAAYGLPAQQILLDAQVRQQSLIGVVGVDASALPTTVRGRDEILAAIDRALTLTTGDRGDERADTASGDPDAADAEFRMSENKEPTEGVPESG